MDVINQKTWKLCVLNGGTGSSVVLGGLMPYDDIEVCGICPVSDSGSATGRVRRKLNVHPWGDVRSAFAARCESPVVQRLLSYCFPNEMENGEAFELTGHKVGTLNLAALELITGGPLEAVDELHRIFKIKGRVIPVSAVPSDLSVELEDGTIISGEGLIDEQIVGRSPIVRCFLDHPVPGNPEAIQRLREADWIVSGPTDLYTNHGALFQTDGIVDALAKSRAKIIFVQNLTTKIGQTEGYTARRFVQKVSEFIAPARIHTIIVNTKLPPPDLARFYALAGEPLVEDDLRGDEAPQILRLPLLADKVVEVVPGDPIPEKRSRIRHDPMALGRVIAELVRSSSR